MHSCYFISGDNHVISTVHSIVSIFTVQCIPAITTQDFIFGYDVVHDNADIAIVHSISVIRNVSVVAIGIVNCISAVAIIHSTAAIGIVDFISGYFIIDFNVPMDHKLLYCCYRLLLIFNDAIAFLLSVPAIATIDILLILLMLLFILLLISLVFLLLLLLMRFILLLLLLLFNLLLLWLLIILLLLLFILLLLSLCSFYYCIAIVNSNSCYCYGSFYCSCSFYSRVAFVDSISEFFFVDSHKALVL